MQIFVSIILALALAGLSAGLFRKVMRELKKLGQAVAEMTKATMQLAAEIRKGEGDFSGKLEERFNEGLNNILNYSMADAFKAGVNDER